MLSNGLVSESYLTCASQVTDNSGPLPKAANPVAATPEYTAGLSIVTPKEFKTGKVILLIVTIKTMPKGKGYGSMKKIKKKGGKK